LQIDGQSPNLFYSNYITKTEKVLHQMTSPIKRNPVTSQNKHICSTRETTKKSPANEPRTRTNFQHFLNEAPRSSFKKLITSTPLLLQGLHAMSLTKSVPGRLKPQDCERTKLCEPPLVPYIPEKDKVQEEVTRLRNLQIYTSLEKDMTLTFLCGTRMQLERHFSCT
jgi:hypothetical protein